MNRLNTAGAEGYPVSDGQRGTQAAVTTGPVADAWRQEAQKEITRAATSGRLKVGKSRALAAAAQEVFTLTLDAETIELLPFKNWGQLDHFKWTVRGKLPHEPAGLEVNPDRVKLLGETVLLNDTAGCDKLERLFNEWLHFEQETLELARRKARPHAAVVAETTSPVPTAGLSFKVAVDKLGQVHISSLRGKDTLACVGLTAAGISSLHQQGLMRKPGTLQTGALHDWVELDGELFSFEKGRNDAVRLEQALNQRYVPAAADILAREVSVFVNAASSSGFDIQFPVTIGGMPDHHRHHLDEHSLELLQDPERCGLLHRHIIVKLVPPNLVFKQRTPDGGEQYLGWLPENNVCVTDDAGNQKVIPLSQPMNLLRLTASQLNAVFNHPAVNKHSPAQGMPAPADVPRTGFASVAVAAALQTIPTKATTPSPPIAKPAKTPAPKVIARQPMAQAAPVQVPLPNLWLQELLAKPALPPDWFACLAYSKMAQHFGNSSEGRFGQAPCWFIRLGGADDLNDARFRGVFLTERGSLGYLNHGHMARFCNGVAFIGTEQSALEATPVSLLASGLDGAERIAFILDDMYRGHFEVSEDVLTDVMSRLRNHGVIVSSLQEILASPEPLQLVWTVPAEQPNPDDPQALQSTPPQT